jgi:hypothetical protein
MLVCAYTFSYTASGRAIDGSARGGGHFLCLRLVTFHTDIVSSMKDYRFSLSTLSAGRWLAHIYSAIHMFVCSYACEPGKDNDILFADNDETSAAVLFAA